VYSCNVQRTNIGIVTNFSTIPIQNIVALDILPLLGSICTILSVQSAYECISSASPEVTAYVEGTTFAVWNSVLAISDSVILSWCFCVSPGNITCSVFIDYQVDCLVSEEYVLEGVSPVVLMTKAKWLNIVLDINGILCHCMEKAGASRMPFLYDVKQGIHSSTVPTIVGPKVVFTRPGLLEFLTEISKFAARIFIWSSMKRSTVDKIVDYLFRGLPLPFDILRQDSCQKIETSRGKYTTVIGGSKEIFLKNLSEALL
jgi:hypothetical protein